MNKTVIGVLFIVAGVLYGSMAFDLVYNNTLGYLVKNNWISQETLAKATKNALGRKPTILLYSLALIIIGIFVLWNRGN